MTYQHDTNQINQLADKLEDPELDTKGLGWKAAFHLRELQGRIAELEAKLYAIGAGGVGQSIKPQVQADTAQEPGTRIPASVPTGWKLVPMEPTAAMLDAAFDTEVVHTEWGVDAFVENTDEVYGAMLAAAPEAPAQQKPVAHLPCCGYTDTSALQWNHYNGVAQCHNCGQVYAAPQSPAQSCCTCTKTADLHKAPAPAQQEPVAWRVRPFDYGIGYEGVDALTTRKEQCEIWARKGWKVEPLYTAPQPTENLHCKSTQKRLATLWGYVKKEPDHFRDATQMVPARQTLTDEKLYALYCEAMKGYYISSLHHWRDAEAHKFARAIEAAVANQPPRQPLTDSQVKELVKKQPAEDLCRWSYGMGIKDAEAAHGITGGQQ